MNASVAWLLDANVVSEMMRPAPEPRVAAFLDDHLPDAFVAAVAARRRLTVVTRNTREFRNTGVNVVDPWGGARE